MSRPPRNGTVVKSPVLPYVIVLPLVVLFFCAGVYVGSLVVDRGGGEEIKHSSLGLPGTNNVFVKWGAMAAQQEGNFLRKQEPSLAWNAPIGNTVDRQPDAEVKPTISELFDPSKALLERSHSSNIRGSIPSGLLTSSTGDSRGRRESLHATPQSYLNAPKGLDHTDLLVSAWVYLQENSIFDNDMRTIFSNKHPGCEASQGQYGISMFVNTWQQSDHKLYVEYGGRESGCHKVDSKSFTLVFDRWYHVAVYTNPHLTALYIDGEEINLVEGGPVHEVQTDNPLFVGVYDNSGQYPLSGNISQLAIVHNLASSSANNIKDVVQRIMVDPAAAVKSIKSVAAYYPLTDASAEKPHSKAIDAANNFFKHDGVYVFPMGSISVAGVRIKLVDGVDGRPVTEDMRRDSDKEARERRESVKQGMRHAWKGYKTYAWGRDEVKPKTNHGSDNWGGMGVTLVDSLDTLWLMGMKEEFQEAREWVASSLSFNHAGTVSVFETTIRELGGLLSAYDLSGDQIFLDKAQLLADKLMPAFSTASGIPTGMVNFRNGQGSGGWSGGAAILSELGSLQVEFRYLAEKTQKRHYELAAMKPFQVVHAKHPHAGLFPIKISNRDGAFADSTITFGALGDSFYEYLLKVWLQGGRKESWLREMYDEAMDKVMDHLLLASDPSGLAFLADWNGRTNNRKMDHLVCFMPGALALGAYTDPRGLDSPRAQRDLAVSKALMYTCYQMYHRTKTGISAEYVEFPLRQDFVPGRNAQFYILRPETAESLFILNKLTGDPIYRDWAWEIWQAIDRTCKTETAYGAIRNVNANGGGGIDDRMESFFLAETMKYLYLAQDPDTEIDLMKYVFNTEAHPMKIFDDSHIPISP